MTEPEYDPSAYIRSQTWTFARTVPTSPHEYLIAQQSTDIDAHWLFLKWIRRHARPDYFPGFVDARNPTPASAGVWKYAQHDGFDYWVSGPRGAIANRRKISDRPEGSTLDRPVPVQLPLF